MDEGGIKFMAHEHLPPSRAPELWCLVFLYPCGFCSYIDKIITKCIFFTCLVVPRLLSCAPSSFYIVTLSYISYIITKVLCINQAAHSRLIALFLLHCRRLTNCIVVSILPCRLFLTYLHSYILYLAVLGTNKESDGLVMYDLK